MNTLKYCNNFLTISIVCLRWSSAIEYSTSLSLSLFFRSEQTVGNCFYSNAIHSHLKNRYFVESSKSFVSSFFLSLFFWFFFNSLFRSVGSFRPIRNKKREKYYSGNLPMNLKKTTAGFYPNKWRWFIVRFAAMRSYWHTLITPIILFALFLWEFSEFV